MKCICRYTLSLDRQENGVDNWPVCDHTHRKLDDLINGIEYEMSGKLDCHDVMRRVLDLTKFIRENLV